MSDQIPVPPPAPEAPKRKSWVARHKVLTFIGALMVIGVFSSVTSNGSSGQDGTGSTPPPVDTSAMRDSGSNAGADTSTDTTDASSSDTSGSTVTITVTSTGSDGGSVTYVNPDSSSFQMSQDTSATFPWKKTWTDVSDLPVGFNMNAQQTGGGTITCTITQDGQVIATNSSSGDYSMVTCTP